MLEVDGLLTLVRRCWSTQDHLDPIVVDGLSGLKRKVRPTKSLWTSDLNLDPCSRERDEHKNLGNAAHRAVAVVGHIAHRAQGGEYRARFCF